jgi:pimeloyl-ACP methyl ester carboxylesterase
MKFADTRTLRIAYLEDGDAEGWPVILSHGFPYDVHAFDEVVPLLVRAGAHVIRPYCRGFGATRFRSDDTMRTGQQAARALDILDLADALELERPILGGFDWGGNASCSAAALWPDRFSGLVSYAGYDVIDVAGQRGPLDPHLERVCWYQHLFQSERGRAGLRENRRDIARMLWCEWSPGWHFDEATFARTAEAFDNPDFVDVVIHCYRWSLGLADGDPALGDHEDRLAQKPAITIPAITLDGTEDPLKPGGTAHHAEAFAGPYEHVSVAAGHAFPAEAPAVFADAILRSRTLIGPSARARRPV